MKKERKKGAGDNKRATAGYMYMYSGHNLEGKDKSKSVVNERNEKYQSSRHPKNFFCFTPKIKIKIK